jgi:hypothetical protein
MSVQFTSKQPSESYAIGFDFTSVLLGESIASAAIDAIDQITNVDATSIVLDGTKQSNTSSVVKGWVQNGESGHNYLITCRIIGAAGSRYELEAILPVLETPAVAHDRAPTYEEFISQYANFASMNPNAVRLSLSLSSRLLLPAAWGDFYADAVGLDAAHALTLEAQAGLTPTGGLQAAVGPVNSVSAAGVSTSFQGFDVTPGSKSDAWYSKTVYGQKFLRLRDNCMPMGMMCS